jgi:hypothetical protein
MSGALVRLDNGKAISALSFNKRRFRTAVCRRQNAGRRSLKQGRELSGRAAGSVENAEAEAVKDPTAATRWSERLHKARLEVRTLSAAPT